MSTRHDWQPSRVCCHTSTVTVCTEITFTLSYLLVFHIWASTWQIWHLFWMEIRIKLRLKRESEKVKKREMFWLFFWYLTFFFDPFSFCFLRAIWLTFSNFAKWPTSSWKSKVTSIATLSKYPRKSPTFWWVWHLWPKMNGTLGHKRFLSFLDSLHFFFSKSLSQYFPLSFQLFFLLFQFSWCVAVGAQSPWKSDRWVDPERNRSWRPIERTEKERGGTPHTTPYTLRLVVSLSWGVVEEKEKKETHCCRVLWMIVFFLWILSYFLPLLLTI